MSSNTGEESAKSNHKVARKQWRNNDMEDAMKAVAEGCDYCCSEF